MGFTRATVAGLLVGAAMANPHYGYGNGTQYTTEVVTAYTTYCPAPTTLTYQDKTYTITEATTLTITDCPCTVSHPLKPTYQPPKPVYTTEVVTKLTTYCPEPTTLTFNNKTYTVTEPTTLTVTDCPCTVTKSHTGP
ncbi:Cell wall protein SED1 [Fusarium floridanum]|uniref:Cell wall protein SED1 n=1 Tax=Fusarium floridanum TaxID=1325733 RepID=A0A428NCQ3_9HYPO|nr:Cell wall protein SED1 [Fusarium floridanum]